MQTPRELKASDHGDQTAAYDKRQEPEWIQCSSILASSWVFNYNSTKSAIKKLNFVDEWYLD